jgi:hypothetical protein
MKKIMAFATASFAALALTAAIASPAMAADPATTVNTSWNGAGTFNFNAVASGSTTANFGTSGNQAMGAITFANLGNNPYGYGVSNTTTDVNASVGNGGTITSNIVRTGSYVPLYGTASQSISAFAGSSDGSAALVNHVGVNYAGMNDIGYGQAKTAGGNTLDASGTAFTLNYAVDTGQAFNSAGIVVNGTGTAGLNLSSSGVSAGGFGLGQGQGIFTQANFSGQGIGTVSTGGVATGSLFVANSGSTVYGTALNPASVTTNINYATTGAQVQSWGFALGGTK